VVQGELIHNLPGPLEHVQIIVFRRQINVRASVGPGLLLTSANAWTLDGEWDPGQPLDLDLVTSAPGLASLSAKLDSLVASGFSSENLPNSGTLLDRFEWLAFFNLLGPPAKPGGIQGPPVARREATHSFDLSRWSTRPCLIIIGTLRLEGESTMPAPMGVATNGAVRNPIYAGTTIVRWVYPLPDNPPEVFLGTQPDAALDTDTQTPDG
jgi:hypothetical protein